MKRYHFNIYDGYSDLDDEGHEFPDWPTARLEAVKLAGAVLKDAAQRVLAYPDWRLEVTDTDGLVLIRLDFSAVESPAAEHVLNA